MALSFESGSARSAMNPDILTEGRRQNSTRRLAASAFAVAIAPFVLTSCGSSEPERRIEAPQKNSRPSFAERHQAAREAARAWLDQLEVDPVALTIQGARGKKKLGEALTAYLHLLRHAADPVERTLISNRVGELAQHTERPEYHNMLNCHMREFNRSNMSYLRVAWVLEQLGWDTTHYRSQLEAIRPRLDSSLAHRSRASRQQFKRYYDYFGWTFPAAAQVSKPGLGVIGRRVPLIRHRPASSYALAHEVSAAFRFGDGTEFDREDLAYLRRVLPPLIIRFGSRRHANSDLLAELLSAMVYLDLHNMPAYHTGIQFLIRSQNPDGTWGAYGEEQASQVGDTDTELYLHTTMVVLRAVLQAEDLARAKPSSEGAGRRSNRLRPIT